MPRSRGRTFVRWLLILLVLGLAATAVALVVLGDSQKQLRIGVLLGIWAAVVAYFLPPARRAEPPEAPIDHDVVRPAYNQVGIRTEPDPRRDYQVQLQRTLRTEMERALNEQVARLSSEVASLRNDLVEKVNGQLRLERTETTRVIGSDIEALQREIRRLAVSREFLTPVPSLPPTRETLTVATVVAQASASERPMGAQLTTPLPAPPSSLPPLRAASTTPPPRPPSPTPPPRVAPPTSSFPVPPPAPPGAPEPAVSRPAPAPSPSRISPLPPPPAISLPKPAVSVPAAPPVAASAAPRVAPSSGPAQPAARPVTLPQTMPPAASSLPPRPPAGPPPATGTRATPPQASPRPATLPPLTRPATPISPVTPPATWTPPAAPANGSRPNGFSAEFGTTSVPPRPPATRSELPVGSRPSMGGEWSSASQWSATRPAGNGAQPSVQPYSAPDPFGEMPRLGVFRDLHDGDIVPALPEGYVGRRRALPSHQAGVRSGM